MKQIKLFLSGDVMLTRRFPNKWPESLVELSEFAKSHDYIFGNLETTVHNRAGYPEAFPGGGHAMSSPQTLQDLKEFGYNVFNLANNHSMDYSHGGLLKTIEYVEQYQIEHAGTGINLSDAELPAYVECKDGRVAMIGFTASFHDSYLAGPQNQDMQGRPGVNPLRQNNIYELQEKEFNQLVDIADKIGINSYHDQARKEGYMPAVENFKFGQYNFRIGTENRFVTRCNKIDEERARKVISDAKLQSDIVIVSIHGHQFKGNSKHNAPDFINDFSHHCIDFGADIVVCHGPHVIRGIEQYKKSLIFHGLGDFILQHESMQWLPEEQYYKQNVSRSDVNGVADFFNKRSNGRQRGLFADPQAWISFVPSITWDGNEMKTKIIPIELSKGTCYGLPIKSVSGGGKNIRRTARLIKRVRFAN